MAPRQPFNPITFAANETRDPADRWLDELEVLVHGLTRPAFVNELRRLPKAERETLIGELRGLKAKLAELLHVDRVARAFADVGSVRGQ